MIDVIAHEKNTIIYKCTDCKISGRCIIKASNKDTIIVIDVKCPVCTNNTRLTLLQYSSEEEKQLLLKDLNTIDLSWVPVINEEIDCVVLENN